MSVDVEAPSTVACFSLQYELWHMPKQVSDVFFFLKIRDSIDIPSQLPNLVS